MLILILVLLVGTASLNLFLDFLSLKTLNGPRSALPAEFKDLYDPEKYSKSLRYQATQIRFNLVSELIETPLLIGFLLLGGFNQVDTLARSMTSSPFWAGLLFAGLLGGLKLFIQLPFSIYQTFVLEEKFGFNQTTPKTFLLDLCKGILVGTILGGILFSGVVYFFETTGTLAWVYAWLAFTTFQLLLTYLAPAVLLPLFNRFEELPDGELKSAIAAYNSRNRFQLQGIYVMDSSRRSSKGNAFFTGFGRFKRLVLFDTLMKQQTTNELVAIFAHEVGHFKLGHILRFTTMSIASSAVLFFCLSWVIGNEALFAAFKMQAISTYASLIFAGLLFSPISRFVGLGSHWLSRKAEFEADRYSVETFGNPEILISALKKLSMDNLSNLNPHRLRVFFDYTHPPILQRIEALRKLAKQPVLRRIY